MKLCLLALSVMATSFGAESACSLPASSAALGTVTSFSVNSTPSTSSSAANINCGNGSVLALLSGNNITLQFAGASNASGTRAVLRRDAGPGLDGIPVQLCTDAACATEMGIGGTPVNFPSANLLNLIGLLGNLNFSIPLYVRTVPGESVAAGTYTGILNVAVTYNICTAISLLGLCLLGAEQNGSGVIPLTITLNVTNDCTTINAPNINFGSAPLVNQFSSVSQSVSVVCTKGSTYTVSMSEGNYAVNNQRYMINGNNRLAYEIYKASGTDRWGNAGSERWASNLSSTISSDGLTRTYNYTARILSAQATPPAGNYTDSVVISLSF